MGESILQHIHDGVPDVTVHSGPGPDADQGRGVVAELRPQPQHQPGQHRQHLSCYLSLVFMNHGKDI